MFKKLFIILIGVVLIGMGIAISILNNIGSDPMSVFAQGISIRLHEFGWTFFTVGNAIITLNVIVFIILVLIYKWKYVNIGTFIGMFCIGSAANIWTKILSDIITNDNHIFYKSIWVIVGVTLISTGVGLFIYSNMGASPLDLISVTISNYLKINYSITRIVCDTVFGLIGWSIGGVVGITTIVSMIFIGPISGIVIRNMKKFENCTLF